METNHLIKILLVLSSILSQSVAVNAESNTSRFNNPMYREKALDWCLLLGHDDSAHCGKPVADLYCELNGYAQASDFSKANDVGVCTRLIGDKQVYCGNDADSFQYISCTK